MHGGAHELYEKMIRSIVEGPVGYRQSTDVCGAQTRPFSQPRVGDIGI